MYPKNRAISSISSIILLTSILIGSFLVTLSLRNVYSNLELEDLDIKAFNVVEYETRKYSNYHWLNSTSFIEWKMINRTFKSHINVRNSGLRTIVIDHIEINGTTYLLNDNIMAGQSNREFIFRNIHMVSLNLTEPYSIFFNLTIVTTNQIYETGCIIQ